MSSKISTTRCRSFQSDRDVSLSVSLFSETETCFCMEFDQSLFLLLCGKLTPFISHNHPHDFKSQTPSQCNLNNDPRTRRTHQRIAQTNMSISFHNPRKSHISHGGHKQTHTHLHESSDSKISPELMYCSPSHIAGAAVKCSPQFAAIQSPAGSRKGVFGLEWTRSRSHHH